MEKEGDKREDEDEFDDDEGDAGEEIDEHERMGITENRRIG
jgi:hypothetical protein